MKIKGTLKELPEGRFTPSGDYQLHFTLQVDDAEVRCMFPGFPAEDWCEVWPEANDDVIGAKVVIDGLPVARRWKDNDGKQRVSTYLRVSELSWAANGKLETFGGRLR